MGYQEAVHFIIFNLRHVISPLFELYTALIAVMSMFVTNSQIVNLLTRFIVQRSRPRSIGYVYTSEELKRIADHVATSMIRRAKGIQTFN